MSTDVADRPRWPTCVTCGQPLPQRVRCHCGHLHQVHNIEVKAQPCSSMRCACGTYTEEDTDV